MLNLPILHASGAKKFLKAMLHTAFGNTAISYLSSLDLRWSLPVLAIC